MTATLLGSKKRERSFFTDIYNLRSFRRLKPLPAGRQVRLPTSNQGSKIRLTLTILSVGFNIFYPPCHLRIKSAPFFMDLKFKSAPLILGHLSYP
jgi:hypothetical protein